MVSTAVSNASALWAAGARNPLTLRTNCSAAARTSSSVTSSVYGGRRVLMLRHMPAIYAGRGPSRSGFREVRLELAQDGPARARSDDLGDDLAVLKEGQG